MWFRKDEDAGPAKRSGVPSLTSADLLITGKIVSLSELQIEGRVEGEVLAGQLIIGESAEVKGWVLGADVTVRGCVIGNIRAKRLHLAASARVEGDMEHESLSVEVGARIEGSCRHVASGIALPAEIAALPAANGASAPSVSAPETARPETA